MGYFEQHLLPEEQNSIPYLPTTVLLLDFITKQYGQQIALSDENQEIRMALPGASWIKTSGSNGLLLSRR